MVDGLELIRFTLGPFEENTYVLLGPSRKSAALIDPGMGSEVILDTLDGRGLRLALIVNTHGHLDHVAANRFFKERTRAPLAIHPLDLPLLSMVRQQGTLFGFQVEDSPPPDIELDEGVPLRFDGMEFEVLHTPGHTPGGVCLRFGRRMLVGDTLFRRSVGRTDLPGGSSRDLVASIRNKLFRLPGDTLCYPGHGPETTLSEERRENAFVSDEALGELSRSPR